MGYKPERIFADDGETPYFYEPDEEVPPTAVEYVRADVAAAEIERLREALERIEREGAGLWLGQIAADALERETER